MDLIHYNDEFVVFCLLVFFGGFLLAMLSTWIIKMSWSPIEVFFILSSSTLIVILLFSIVENHCGLKTVSSLFGLIFATAVLGIVIFWLESRICGLIARVRGEN